MATKKKAKKPKSPKPPKAPAPKSGTILAWEDDPGALPGLAPVPRSVPDLAKQRLRVQISDSAPVAKQYPLATREFRYWAGADALARAAEFWSGVVPSSFQWQVGQFLPVHLDVGVDLNAFYTRGGPGMQQGLNFFRDTVSGRSVFSGESPDVVVHELGHAVLDALRPELFDTMAIEAAAFHESFGDMSALLVALQIPKLRLGVLADTGGRIARSSRVSRLAEQLGWAIRQQHPDAVDPDCLRNAANSFFYRDPESLPPSAPANLLSSEPHSFSRVFTAAFLEVIGGIALTENATPGEADLLKAANNAGQLLVEAVGSAPVVPQYFTQIAAHFISADAKLFKQKYRDVIKGSFVRRGILSLEAATMDMSAVAVPKSAARKAKFAALPVAAEKAAAEQFVALRQAKYGLKKPLNVVAPAEKPRFAVTAAATDTGGLEPPPAPKAAESFVEDLFRRGRIDLGDHGNPAAQVSNPFIRKTHELREAGNGLIIVRRNFDCGFDAL